MSLGVCRSSRANHPTCADLTATWNVLARGRISDILLIALKQRCYNDNLDTERETLATQFRLHLHRLFNCSDPNLKNRGLDFNSYPVS